MEHVVFPENVGILGVKTEDNADTKDIEPTQGLGRVVIVLLQ